MSHAGSLPMSIVFLNVAEEGEGEDDTRLQVRRWCDNPLASSGS